MIQPPQFLIRHSILPACLVFLLLAAALLPPIASARVNVQADNLSKLLVPKPAKNAVGPKDLSNTESRLIDVLELIEKSNISSGPPAEDLLENAVHLNLKHLLSKKRTILTIGNVMRAWRSAHYLGLFTDNGKFRRKITKGADQGKNCIIEYIVPAKSAPAFSTDLANLRIVEPSKARPPKAGNLTPEDQNALGQFKTIEKEALQGLPDAMGRTQADNLKLWKAEVEATDDALSLPPSIRIEGGLTSSPSSINDFKWRVSLEMINLSRHPTEVTVECYILCSQGDNSDKLFVFSEHTDTVKLRSTEVWEKEYWTKSIGRNPHDKDSAKGANKGKTKDNDEDDKKRKKGKKGKKPPLPEMRGWMARVLHNGKTVAADASLRSMHDNFEVISSMPRSGDREKK
jgi:hypothetical protein